MSEAFLGIDVGTSGLKLLVVDVEGTVLARASAPYNSHYREGGWAEQNPEDWIEALTVALRTVSDEVRQRITAIGAVGHVPSLVLVDETGSTLRPALTWQDTRSTEESLALNDQFGSVRDDIGTELPWAPSQLLPKLAWVSTHEPDVRSRTRWVLQPKDVINFFLTGQISTDPWSSKGICDVTSGSPATRLLTAVGWSTDACPPTRPPWDALARIAPATAETLGLSPTAVVASGWSDALAAMLAVGVFDSPRGFVLTGTSNIVGISLLNAASADGLYTVPAGPSAPLPLLYGPTQSGGEALLWASRLLGVDVSDLVALAASAEPTDVPVFVPYLRGERAPIWNTDVRSLAIGLEAQHGRAEFARAVVDGVAFSARHVLEVAGVQPGSVIDMGGVGSDDSVVATMWANALSHPVRVHREPSLSALGAAMLAARAAGLTPSDLARLRAQPATFEASEPAKSDTRYREYRDAVTIAVEWSTP